MWLHCGFKEKPMQPNEEARESRVDFQRNLRIVPLNQKGNTMFHMASSNMSRNGIFVDTEQPLTPGTKVAISLETGGVPLPFAEAQVTWNRDWEGHGGFGARFTSFLHPEAQSFVESLVDLKSEQISSVRPKRRSLNNRLKMGLGAAVLVAVAVLTFALTNETKAPVAASVAAPENQVQVEAEQLTALPTTVAAIPVTQNEVKSIKRELNFVSQSIKGVTLLAQGQSFEVVPNGKGKLEKAFEMTNPARLVMDFSGTKLTKKQTVKVNGQRVKQVRVMKTEDGTRLVFDLNANPLGVKTEGNRVLLSFR
jgi:hypothetical protein